MKKNKISMDRVDLKETYERVCAVLEHYNFTWTEGEADCLFDLDDQRVILDGYLEGRNEENASKIEIAAKKFNRGVILYCSRLNKEIVWSRTSEDSETLFTVDHSKQEGVVLRDQDADVYCSAFGYTSKDVYQMCREYADYVRESGMLERQIFCVDDLDELLDFDFEKFSWAE